MMASPGESPNERDAASASKRRITVPPVEARQGVIGHNVQQVLGFGLGAVVIAFAIIYIIYFA